MSAETINQSPTRPQTRFRESVKWILWRALPESAYQRMLAWAKARDFESGIFREPELDLVPLLLREGDTAIDVGANHGMWSLAFSKAVGSTGQVFAFEPVPFTFGTLEALVDRLGLENVETTMAGCSDEAGVFSMVIPEQGAGASDDLQAHLAEREGDSPEPAVHSVDCEVIRLDDALGDLESVEMVKMDIEGAELKALRGARGIIERHLPVVVCEVNEAFLEGFGQSRGELHDFMDGFGYRAFHYSGDRVMRPLDSLDSIEHSNVVFGTSERMDRLGELVA